MSSSQLAPYNESLLTSRKYTCTRAASRPQDELLINGATAIIPGTPSSFIVHFLGLQTTHFTKETLPNALPNRLGAGGRRPFYGILFHKRAVDSPYNGLLLFYIEPLMSNGRSRKYVCSLVLC